MTSSCIDTSAAPSGNRGEAVLPLLRSLMADWEVPTRSAMAAWVNPDAVSARNSAGQSIIVRIIGRPMRGRNRSADNLFLPPPQNRCMKPIGLTLGERVRDLRKERQLNQTQLAALMEIGQGSLSDIETGVTKELSGKVLAGLCEHLRTTPKYLLTGHGSLGKEAAIRLAELMKLATDMSDQALAAMVETARTVVKATGSAPIEEEPDGQSQVSANEEIGQILLDGTLTGFVFGGIIKGRKYFVSLTGTAYADPTLARGVTAAIDDELQLMVQTRIDRATTIL